MARIFTEFNEEIAADIRKNAPIILFKYRDWKVDTHKAILTENKIWFAHPKELNDPYDIRIPVRFNYDEVNHPLFLEKLRLISIQELNWLSPGSREIRILTENRLKLIKEYPEKYFEENYLVLRESKVYDGVGVFSLTKNELNETMWAHYGNNSKGFCIGFNTVELCRNIITSFGPVRYEDNPPVYSFIKEWNENEFDNSFFKHSKWSHEEEFRLITYGINNSEERLKEIPEKTIEEIVLGEKISEKDTKEIISVLISKYNRRIKLYKAIPGNFYSYKKKIISY